jgi:hypothetical protein
VPKHRKFRILGIPAADRACDLIMMIGVGFLEMRIKFTRSPDAPIGIFFEPEDVIDNADHHATPARLGNGAMKQIIPGVPGVPISGL